MGPSVKRYLPLVLVIIGAIVLYNVWEQIRTSDEYVKANNPRKYWTERIEEIRGNIEFQKKWIRSTELRIHRLHATRPMRIEEIKIWSDTPEAAAIEEEAAINEEIAIERAALLKARSRIETLHEELARARNQLSRLQ